LCLKLIALLKILMHLMSDPESQTAACTALDGFLEILGAQIALYINMIMERLGGLLETGSIRVKSLVTGAIGSAAHAAGPAFKEYFPVTLKRLYPFFSLTAEGEEQELRGVAMDALGTFAESIGKDDFRPYFADTMTMALAGLELGSARLKECSFLLFAVLAKIFEGEFTPYLSRVVPPLLESCTQLEHGEPSIITADIGGFSVINTRTALLTRPPRCIREST
jgi:importin-4